MPVQSIIEAGNVPPLPLQHQNVDWIARRRSKREHLRILVMFLTRNSFRESDSRKLNNHAQVFNVLEQQGRSALLSHAIISNILGQLMVQVSYDPLECKEVETDLSKRLLILISTNSIYRRNEHAVEALRRTSLVWLRPNIQLLTNCERGAFHCDVLVNEPIATTNTIMASRSRQKWQDVVNRAVRMLALGSF
ncbi:hypothetical protein KIN20_003218 [Parelaphostrongylus tenuis]|uniref:Uncharacterized protein n=1 Tax=Parelaphostrongylus tenuis TaxID=148309 RepID=A0AAD5QHA0_PARTN|nr:hypothetical protein KIN20_003218 [Parelaphostrongylus tenuis]